MTLNEQIENIKKLEDGWKYDGFTETNEGTKFNSDNLDYIKTKLEEFLWDIIPTMDITPNVHDELIFYRMDKDGWIFHMMLEVSDFDTLFSINRLIKEEQNTHATLREICGLNTIILNTDENWNIIRKLILKYWKSNNE